MALSTPSSRDSLLARVDLAGNRLWLRPFQATGSGAFLRLDAIGFDDAGGLLVAGRCTGTVTLGGPPVFVGNPFAIYGRFRADGAAMGAGVVRVLLAGTVPSVQGFQGELLLCHSTSTTSGPVPSIQRVAF